MGDTRRTRLVLALLLVTSFTLITLDIRGGGDSAPAAARRFAANVLAPLEQAVAGAVRPVSGLVERANRLGDDGETIRELRAENDALRFLLRTSGLARNRAAELDRLLKVASLGQYRIVPARVVALGRAQDFAFTATLDAGARDGVRRDQTVLSGSGLVGRVSAVSSTSATVLLAVDPGSSVAVRLERTMDIGVAKGNGRDPAALELLDPSRVLTKGDRLVTFGSPGGSPYVPGLPYGEVTSVSRRLGGLTTKASVTPFVDFDRIDLVGVVIAAPRADPRDSVLPPKPRAPGAATPAGAQ